MCRRRPDQVNYCDVATRRSFLYREIPPSYVTGRRWKQNGYAELGLWFFFQPIFYFFIIYIMYNFFFTVANRTRSWCVFCTVFALPGTNTHNVHAIITIIIIIISPRFLPKITVPEQSILHNEFTIPSSAAMTMIMMLMMMIIITVVYRAAERCPWTDDFRMYLHIYIPV